MPRAQKPQALPAGISSVKRDQDFSFNGEYIVTLSCGKQVRIFRDTDQFGPSFAIWYVVDHELIREFTKAELLERVVSEFGQKQEAA